MMDFTMIKNCFDWGFYQANDIKIYVQAGNINSDEFKQITGQDYSTDQQQTQTNQGTTNQNQG